MADICHIFHRQVKSGGNGRRVKKRLLFLLVLCIAIAQSQREYEDSTGDSELQAFLHLLASFGLILL
jgi:hypothetical protein